MALNVMNREGVKNTLNLNPMMAATGRGSTPGAATKVLQDGMSKGDSHSVIVDLITSTTRNRPLLLQKLTIPAVQSR